MKKELLSGIGDNGLPSSTTPPLPPLSIRLFGAFKAVRGDKPLSGLTLREGRRLLAYLLLRPDRPLTSFELAKRFWPSDAQFQESGQGDFPSVRQALFALRQALGPDAGRLTRPSRSTIQFDSTGLDVDLYAFDRLAKPETAATAATVAVNEDAQAELWQQAAALYTGPLLANWNDPWLEGDRQARRRAYEEILLRLASFHARQDRLADSEMWLRRLLASHPVHEEALRAFMRLLERQGRIDEALAAFAAFGDTQTAPPRSLDEETLALADDMRRRGSHGQGRQSAGSAAFPAATDSAGGDNSRDSLQAPEPAGGPVPVQSRFYVIRQADTELRAALARHDSIVLIKGAGQTGKTSLLARGLQQMRDAENRIVLTDFQKLNSGQLATADTFYRALAAMIVEQLDLPVSLRAVWDEDFGPNLNMERFLRRHVLTAISGPLIWGMDGVDRLFGCPFGDDVFGLFRSWHNERSLMPSSDMGRLTLVIAYATEAQFFITDPNQSPFNVGTRLTLEDFTPEQIADLNARSGSPLSPSNLARLHDLAGGQPYLVRLALEQTLRAAATPESGGDTNTAFEKIVVDAAGGDSGGIFLNHLRGLSQSLAQSPLLSDAVNRLALRQSPSREASSATPVLSPEEFYRLHAAGIVSGASTYDTHFRCRLYALYFGRQSAEAEG